MAANTSLSQPQPTDKPRRVFDGNSPEAYHAWTLRTGRVLWQYTQQHAGWAVRCPQCGGLLLLEITFDSENGSVFSVEQCPCGGAL